MVKILSLTVTFLFGAIICCAQIKTIAERMHFPSYSKVRPETQYELNKDTSLCRILPLVIINNANEVLTTSQETFSLIDPKEIKDLFISKDAGTLKKYGPAAKNGVMIATLKRKFSFINIRQLFDVYNTDSKSRELPVFIDSSITCTPEKVCFELKGVKSVKLAEEKNTEMQYISIISIYPIKRYPKGTVFIKGLKANTK